MAINRHFILTLGRSGSNALVDVINQHPHALNYGELLGDWNAIRKAQRRFFPKQDDIAYLDSLLTQGAPLRTINALRNGRKILKGDAKETQRISAIKTIGCKDFSNLMSATPDLRHYLMNRPDCKVVGLVRENVIARFVSWKRLEQTGTVKLSVGDTLKTSHITLNPKTLPADLSGIAQESAALDAMLSELPERQVMRIRYEDYFSNPDAMAKTTQAMFTFLGLSSHPAKMRARKINTLRLRDTIQNYDACLTALKGTSFEQAFHAAG